MLDVEFLLSPPQSWNRPVVYFYSEGSLRHEVLAALRDVLGVETVLSNPAQDGFGIDGGLFGAALYCDTGEIEVRAKREHTIANILSAERTETILFIKGSLVAFTKLQGSDARLVVDDIEAKWIVIEECVISRATLPAVYDYLEKTTDLPMPATPRDREGLREHLCGYLAVSASVSFLDLLHEFERAVLLFVDEQTGAFRARSATKDLKKRSFVALPFRQLVCDRNSDVLPDLLRAVERRHPSATAKDMLVELIALTRQLIGFLSSRSQLQSFVHVNLSIWVAVLLASLYSADGESEELNGTVLLDRLVREFLRISAPKNLATALNGLWSHIDRVPAAFETADEMRRELAEALSRETRLLFQWQEQLRSLLEKKSNPAVSDVVLATNPPPIHKAKALSDIVGQNAAVGQLTERCTRNEHSRPLLLVGPNGVGKRTLAGAYAKMAVCEEVPSKSHEACGICKGCTSFDSGLSLFSINARWLEAARHFRTLLTDTIRYEPWGGRHIVIIDEVDFNPDLMESALKTLEKTSENCMFIFLAENASEVNPAFRSRCEVVPLFPLEVSSIKSIARECSDGRLDDLVIDLLAASSEGLPGKLMEDLGKLAGLIEVDIGSAMEALTANWGPAAIEWWRKILRGEGAGSCFHGASSEQAASRVRATLGTLYKLRLGNTLDPGFAFGPIEGLNNLAKSLDERARTQSSDWGSLWSKLAKIWSEEDVMCASGFEQAVYATRSALNSVSLQSL